MGGFGPGCPLSRACCVITQNHHPPARARFTGDNLDRKFNVPQGDGDMVPRVKGGPPSPVASWLNTSTRAKGHSSAVSNPLPTGYETGIIPLDHGGTNPLPIED